MNFVGTHQFAYELTAKEIIFQQTVKKKKQKKKQAKKISSHLKWFRSKYGKQERHKFM